MGENQETMQVCRNGHVITALLRTFPEQGLNRCDRCGAETLTRCPTCGGEITAAAEMLGMSTIGRGRPPEFCTVCGARFPWASKGVPARPESPFSIVESLLRRLPLTIRQLRSRYSDRPPFVVRDEHDLEDLLRAVLPLHFDDVRLESRTPAYARRTRTDLILATPGVAITAKCISAEIREPEIMEQWNEDIGYYARHAKVRRLIGFCYDPEKRIINPASLETAMGRNDGALDGRGVIAG